MARLTGPDEAVRLVYVTTGSNKGKASAQGMSAVLYADAALTTLANVQTTLGAAIPESTVIVDAYSKLPLFLFPDGVDTIYTSINGGPPVPLYARTDDRLDALAAAVAAAQSAANAAESPAGAQAKADAAQAAATAAAASDATAKANAVATAAAATAASGDAATLASSIGAAAGLAIVFGA